MPQSIIIFPQTSLKPSDIQDDGSDLSVANMKADHITEKTTAHGVQGQTPSVGDDSTKLGTTAWIKAAITAAINAAIGALPTIHSYYAITASDTLLLSDDRELTITAVNPSGSEGFFLAVTLPQNYLPGGTFRFKYKLKMGGSGTAHAAKGFGGMWLGTQGDNGTTDYVEFSEDKLVRSGGGTTLTLGAWNPTAGQQAIIKEFRVYGTKTVANP
ncbi:hypothetical protein [uncultured Methanoregula sp.]|uniref:hypothetical protein n=1 Tax=uncultured Methanoregula sp. TaxID=1005933 RepID=UPI002AAAA641|nr:hypothetical protein [uncultured Methanoregula sp.]